MNWNKLIIHSEPWFLHFHGLNLQLHVCVQCTLVLSNHLPFPIPLERSQDAHLPPSGLKLLLFFLKRTFASCLDLGVGPSA